MSYWLILFIYILSVYGLSNMMVFGTGPFKIFEKIRTWSLYISEHFSSLFSCMMCLPANVGWIISLIDWFLLSQITLTPFNLLLYGTNLWYIALIGDCCFTSGIVWILHNVELFFENIGGGNISQDDTNNNTIELYD